MDLSRVKAINWQTVVVVAGVVGGVCGAVIPAESLDRVLVYGDVAKGILEGAAAAMIAFLVAARRK